MKKVLLLAFVALMSNQALAVNCTLTVSDTAGSSGQVHLVEEVKGEFETVFAVTVKGVTAAVKVPNSTIGAAKGARVGHVEAQISANGQREARLISDFMRAGDRVHLDGSSNSRLICEF